MKKAHMLLNGKEIACKSTLKGELNLSWDLTNPDALICPTCFNYFSKSGDYHSSSCKGITVLEMSKINLMSV